ncbi:MAG: peptide chain release factor 2 [Chloroflexota bacterium]|nr:peptide chain release factor 2 [Chloroflexota bacterium]
MVHLDIPAREEEITRIEADSAKPDFWSNPAEARATMRQLGGKKNLVGAWRAIEKKVTELHEITTLAVEQGDDSLKKEIKQELQKVTSQLERKEKQLVFAGEYDTRNALVALHAGAGGTESQDWANMLLRMYIRWAERNDYQAEILDTSPGEEAGIKSAVVEIKGDYAYGYLKCEHGVHRLVRLSPFDADHARHTSFALVEVLPEAEESLDIEINPEDLRVDTFRSSGPGGQHMQKTSSAVRVTHLPTGLVATCESQRSQHQNKETALKILYTRLLTLKIREKTEEIARLKGKRIEAGWGNQIRSYVLHPYRTVKDHRTGYEVNNAEAVLDGEIDGFITACLESKMGEEK